MRPVLRAHCHAINGCDLPPKGGTPNPDAFNRTRFIVQICPLRAIYDAMKNPFPGMNPGVEEYWRDVHPSFLVSARDDLNGESPPGPRAGVDERWAFDADEKNPRQYVPDVAVTESWDRPPGPALGEGGSLVAAA